MEELVKKMKENIKTISKIHNDPELFIVMTKAVDVCNENGSSIRSPKCVNCGPWKKHWENLTLKKWPTLCSNSDCLNTATVGGHVVFADNKIGRKYIIPLCEDCNKKSSDEIFTIDKGTIMVSANCSDTCDKLR